MVDQLDLLGHRFAGRCPGEVDFSFDPKVALQRIGSTTRLSAMPQLYPW